MPITDCEDERSTFWFVVERLRTVLPVIAFTPAEVAIPRICPRPILDSVELLLRFATMLPVTLVLVLLELRMPVTCWPPVLAEIAALRLFAVVALPTVLLLMMFAPPVTMMP